MFFGTPCSWVLTHLDIKFESKNQFSNNLKIIQKSTKLRIWPSFWTILKIFAKLIFALKFNIWLCEHPNNMHKNFLKFLSQAKNWRRLQNQQNHILHQKNFVAGRNLPYVVWVYRFSYSYCCSTLTKTSRSVVSFPY